MFAVIHDGHLSHWHNRPLWRILRGAYHYQLQGIFWPPVGKDEDEAWQEERSAESEEQEAMDTDAAEANEDEEMTLLTQWSEVMAIAEPLLQDQETDYPQSQTGGASRSGGGDACEYCGNIFDERHLVHRMVGNCRHGYHIDGVYSERRLLRCRPCLRAHPCVLHWNRGAMTMREPRKDERDRPRDGSWIMQDDIKLRLVIDRQRGNDPNDTTGLQQLGSEVRRASTPAFGRSVAASGWLATLASPALWASGGTPRRPRLAPRSPLPTSRAGTLTGKTGVLRRMWFGERAVFGAQKAMAEPSDDLEELDAALVSFGRHLYEKLRLVSNAAEAMHAVTTWGRTVTRLLTPARDPCGQWRAMEPPAHRQPCPLLSY